MVKFPEHKLMAIADVKTGTLLISEVVAKSI